MFAPAAVPVAFNLPAAVRFVAEKLRASRGVERRAVALLQQYCGTVDLAKWNDTHEFTDVRVALIKTYEEAICRKRKRS